MRLLSRKSSLYVEVHLKAHLAGFHSLTNSSRRFLTRVSIALMHITVYREECMKVCKAKPVHFVVVCNALLPHTSTSYARVVQ